MYSQFFFKIFFILLLTGRHPDLKLIIIINGSRALWKIIMKRAIFDLIKKKNRICRYKKWCMFCRCMFMWCNQLTNPSFYCSLMFMKIWMYVFLFFIHISNDSNVSKMLSICIRKESLLFHVWWLLCWILSWKIYWGEKHCWRFIKNINFLMALNIFLSHSLALLLNPHNLHIRHFSNKLFIWKFQCLCSMLLYLKCLLPTKKRSSKR